MHIENDILNNLLILKWDWKLIFRQAIYLEYNQQKCIKFPRRFVKELFDFLFWRPEDNGQPPNEFCACAFQKQLVWISRLNFFQILWRSTHLNDFHSVETFDRFPFTSLIHIITNLWVIYEVFRSILSIKCIFNTRYRRRSLSFW